MPIIPSDSCRGPGTKRLTVPAKPKITGIKIIIIATKTW